MFAINEGMTLGTCFETLKSYLQTNGFENPVLEAMIILSEALNLDYHNIKKSFDKIVSENDIDEINKFKEKLDNKTPIQYTLGYTYVKNQKILITPTVLLPGPEIELMIDKSLEVIGGEIPIIIDMCTGSGVIAVILGKTHPESIICAVDISENALEVARKNAKLAKVFNIHFLQGNMFNVLNGLYLEGKVDVIVSNPPYCKTGNLSKLPEQIRGHVPRMAIDGGIDGLSFHRIIANESPNFLKKGGKLIIENEVNQEREIIELLDENNFEDITLNRNHKNDIRVICATYQR